MSNVVEGIIFRYEKVPVILVGNKVDLESEREVSSNEGRALAEEWGCPFMETSAKSKTMVDELFAEIVRQMNYAAQPDKDDPCCSACTCNSRHSQSVDRVISLESYAGIITELTEATVVDVKHNHGRETRRMPVTTYN
ncbi:Ras-related protein Rap-2a [Camelus dromedarius]|uniref:Ras-related protein Rap-2a n=1 Tax=Camelus dromedarius TaxID=9838 RepID=A0A5N4DA13_CAMDR|nr:Ras-related protein Rap-2a [Camelus dromedarius]